jgi:uncharacterized cupin superfamily protein
MSGQAAGRTRPKHVIHQDDLEWQEETSADRGSRFFRKKLGAATSAERLGCSLMRIPARTPSWPRHYHTANEEAVYVLSGAGKLRMGEDDITIAAGDYVALPLGEAHAHRIVNDSDADLVFLCFSTMIEPDVVVYPDSRKLGVFVGAAPGGRIEASSLKRFYPLDADVDYWTGE